MKKFEVGTQYAVAGKIRKVTKVNTKSVYFGKLRFDIIVVDDAQTIEVTDDIMTTVIEAGNVATVDDSHTVQTESNEEDATMAQEIMNETTNTEEVIETTAEPIVNDSQTAIDVINAVEAREAAEEAAAAEAQKYTEYVVMKANKDDTTLWWDIVRKAKGENISDIINPLHEEYNPKFVALVAVNKVKKYLADPTVKGMVQTLRDVTKKYAKVSGIDNPTAGQIADVFSDIIEALSHGMNAGSWNAAPEATEEDAE